jgi:hypothetical protein
LHRKNEPLIVQVALQMQAYGLAFAPKNDQVAEMSFCKPTFLVNGPHPARQSNSASPTHGERERQRDILSSSRIRQFAARSIFNRRCGWQRVESFNEKGLDSGFDNFGIWFNLVRAGRGPGGREGL